MPGFSGFDDFLSEMTVNGKILEAEFYKVSTAPEAAGTWASLWRVGHWPAAGADPATTPGTAYDNDDGGLAAWADQASDTKHLVSLAAAATLTNQLLLYDRLVGVSGISVASTGNKTISSVALPRYTSGEGVECWLEVTTATATTIPVVAMNSYTDQDGNTGAAGGNLSFPAAATNVNTLIGPLPMAAGDRGIQAVSTINVVTAGSAGVVNLVLLKPLAMLPLAGGLGNALDFMTMLPSLPRIYDNATLALAFLASSTTAVSFWGSLRGAYG